MESSHTGLAPSQQELYRFLSRSIGQLRWGILAALLLVTMAQPTISRIGLPTWSLLGLFAGYNMLLDLLGTRSPRRFSFARVAILDLLVAGFLYFLGNEAGGPLFVLFFLAVDSAAAALSLRGILLYTAAVAVIAAADDVVLRPRSSALIDLRSLGVRLIMLAIVGIGMSILTRRLALEHAVAHAAHTEAERLEELERLRGDFTASVSHDLRTPLTAARAALILLETSARDRHRADEQALLDNTRRNIERLDLLINDLLTHNQLEAGAIQLDHEPLDLRAVVTDAIAVVHPLLQDKDQLLEVDLGEPLLVLGDPRRLEQVMVNLLGNANRHTPAGTRIAIDARTEGDEIRLAVRDNGEGIPRDELEMIFQRFYRRAAADAGGSGLGLAIAKAIVELHGGRVWAESRPGAGTTFYVALPVYAQGGQP